MSKSEFDLNTLLVGKGWSGRTVSVEHLNQLQATIDGARDEANLTEAFHQECLSFFQFEPPAELPQASTVIIVAVPTPAMRVYCHWKGQRISVDIPPTYVDFYGRIRRVQDTLAGWLAEAGYQMARPKLPLKTLAVHSALARYGHNNICFVPGMGSYLQLVGVYTDLPCVEDSWHEPQSLEQCDTCDACLQKCPTGAILPDRFLLQADRCLTFFNENQAAFPDWIDPAWHNCLIGCLRCQTVCPENRTVRKWVEERGELDEGETALLVAGTPLDRLPEETARKLTSLQLSGHQLLCRNLGAIMDQVSG